jgi:hypothetical protein
VTISRVLLICSLIVFALAAFGLSAPVNLVALGLAFFAAGHVV